MIANYHTHTWRCRHADGTEREYVERAIEGGLKILGFSDHSPYPFPDGYDSGMRMRLDQVEGYVDTVLALKKEYDKDIEIHLGLETEYFPRFWDQLIDFLSDYPFEYFVLGQHSLGNEIEKILYSGHGTTDGSYLKQYVDQCLAGIDTGKYLYLAHPDLFLFNGDEAVFDREYRRLCREVKKRNIPLEINFLGLMEERWYPNEKFWKIAGEEGNTAVFEIYRPFWGIGPKFLFYMVAYLMFLYFSFIMIAFIIECAKFNIPIQLFPMLKIAGLNCMIMGAFIGAS